MCFLCGLKSATGVAVSLVRWSSCRWAGGNIAVRQQGWQERILNLYYYSSLYIYILYTYLIVATPLIHAFILGIYKSSDEIWSVVWRKDLVGKLLAVEAPGKGRDRFDWKMWILFGWFCSCFSMFFLMLRCCFCPCLFVILRCWNKMKRHVASPWFQNGFISSVESTDLGFRHDWHGRIWRYA